MEAEVFLIVCVMMENTKILYHMNAKTVMKNVLPAQNQIHALLVKTLNTDYYLTVAVKKASLMITDYVYPTMFVQKCCMMITCW